MEKNKTSLTPMMLQFFALKKEHPDFLLFFRLGDFYELFETDAQIASPILGIALTKRQETPMCGFPHHAKNNYLHRLIKANYKVAICEQVETTKNGKKTFDRKVVELVTPGSFSDENYQKEDTEHFLMAFIEKDGNAAFCLTDISTGKLNLIQTPNTQEEIAAVLEKFTPSEIIFAQTPTHKIFENYYSTLLPSYYFYEEENIAFLKQHFNVSSLKAFNLENPLFIAVCGSSLKYLKNNLLNDIIHINTVEILQTKDFVYLSDTTIKSLELLQDFNKINPAFSLYNHLNHTKTAMGARFLRHTITHPFTSKPLIETRFNIISYFIENKNLLFRAQEILKKIPDLERLLGRIALHKAIPQDISYFFNGLKNLSDLKELISIKSIFGKDIENLTFLTDLIQKCLVKNPPVSFGEEPVICTGFSQELDDLRKKALNSYSLLIEIEKREKEINNLPKLRLKYTKQTGYYFELPKGKADKIPSYFIPKQSLVNLERYTIKELISFENDVLDAKNLLELKEREVFTELCREILIALNPIKQNIELIKEMDLLCAFTLLSLEQNYLKPSISKEIKLKIINGRHPVVEKFVENFTSNSVELDTTENRLLIISGPNMAGKSTFLRQTALITLMAHIGCFVPAEIAEIPLVDKIFTRIGASDNLSKGESTFLVEMAETAEILNNTTQNSLIIMDEIGRGTSTNDGLSLAWAIVEHLGVLTPPKGMVLFATHYHELWVLEKNKGIKNFHVTVSDFNGKLVFLHKVIRGFTDKSYGLHVAEIAGINSSIINRAKELLETLESNISLKVKETQKTNTQHLITSQKKENILLEKIQKFNINNTSPLQALFFLQELKKELDKSEKNVASKEHSLFDF